jgi:hypothetical protein
VLGVCPGRAIARWRYAVGSSRHSSRKSWRGEQGDRLPQESWPDRRALGDASTLDRRVAQVRVVDPRHPLYDHCYPVSDRRSGRGPALIVIQLPDGRERAIPRSATAVASASDDPAMTAGRLAHISVRTLLPLANHVRAVLASRHADLEAGERHLEQATAAHGGVAGSAATPVAAAADRDTTSPGTTDRPACATSAPRVRARRGG